MSLLTKSLETVLVNQRIYGAKLVDKTNLELVLENNTVIVVAAEMMCDDDDCKLKVSEVKRVTTHIADLE